MPASAGAAATNATPGKGRPKASCGTGSAGWSPRTGQLPGTGSRSATNELVDALAGRTSGWTPGPPADAPPVAARATRATRRRVLVGLTINPYPQVREAQTPKRPDTAHLPVLPIRAYRRFLVTATLGSRRAADRRAAADSGGPGMDRGRPSNPISSAGATVDRPHIPQRHGFRQHHDLSGNIVGRPDRCGWRRSGGAPSSANAIDVGGDRFGGQAVMERKRVERRERPDAPGHRK